MDSFFAVACVILAGCLCAVGVYANDLRRKLDAQQRVIAAAERLAEIANAHLAKFDHDGDGKPGGSLKRRMTDEELEEFGRQWRSHEDVCTEPVSYVDKARGRAEGR